MRIGRTEPTKVVVIVVTSRPAKPGEKNNRGKAYKEGQAVRETHQSVDVYDATAEQVTAAVVAGLRAAENKK